MTRDPSGAAGGGRGAGAPGGGGRSDPRFCNVLVTNYANPRASGGDHTLIVTLWKISTISITTGKRSKQWSTSFLLRTLSKIG